MACPGSPLQKRGVMGRKRFLVIDDEEMIRLIAVRALSRHFGEAEVECAGNGADGLTKALDGEFDLIFCDVIMPCMGGTEVASALRQAGNNTPLLLVSGFTGEQTGELQGLLASGSVQGFVAKPFRPSDLIARAVSILDAPSPT